MIGANEQMAALQKQLTPNPPNMNPAQPSQDKRSSALSLISQLRGKSGVNPAAAPQQLTPKAQQALDLMKTLSEDEVMSVMQALGL